MSNVGAINAGYLCNFHPKDCTVLRSNFVFVIGSIHIPIKQVDITDSLFENTNNEVPKLTVESLCAIYNNFLSMIGMAYEL